MKTRKIVPSEIIDFIKKQPGQQCLIKVIHQFIIEHYAPTGYVARANAIRDLIKLNVLIKITRQKVKFNEEA